MWLVGSFDSTPQATARHRDTGKMYYTVFTTEYLMMAWELDGADDVYYLLLDSSRLRIIMQPLGGLHHYLFVWQVVKGAG